MRQCNRDVNKTLSHNTETRSRRAIFSNSQDRDETETLNPEDRDETRRSKNVLRPQCRSLKTPTGEVSHFTTCFLRVRSIIFFMIYSHCMHIHKTKVTRPRPRRYIFKTETRPRRSTFKTETRRDVPKNVSRPRRSRPRLHPCSY